MDAQYLDKLQKVMMFYTKNDAKNIKRPLSFSFVHQLFTILIDLPPKHYGTL